MHSEMSRIDANASRLYRQAQPCTAAADQRTGKVAGMAASDKSRRIKARGTGIPDAEKRCIARDGCRDGRLVVCGLFQWRRNERHRELGKGVARRTSAIFFSVTMHLFHRGNGVRCAGCCDMIIFRMQHFMHGQADCRIESDNDQQQPEHEMATDHVAYAQREESPSICNQVANFNADNDATATDSPKRIAPHISQKLRMSLRRRSAGESRTILETDLYARRA